MLSTKKTILTASFMMFATVLSKVFGQLRESLIAGNFAAGIDAVAYFAASSIPIILFDFAVGGVISGAFVPVFNERLINGGKKDALKFANNYINIVVLITGIITVLGIVFGDALIALIAPDVSEAAKPLARELSSIMFPMIIFTGAAFSCVGVLQSFDEFNIPSLMSLVSNAAIIVYFFTLKSVFGIRGLAVTTLAAWSLQLIIQIPALKKIGFSYSFDFRVSEHIRRVAKLALPMLVSTWVLPLCNLINMRLASGLNGGAAIPCMNYASRLYIIVVGVFTFVVTNLVFPHLSRASAQGEPESAKKISEIALRSVFVIVIPIFICFALFSKEITTILYGWGEFTEDNASLTAGALFYYSFGMLALGVCEVLNKTFFSAHDSKSPMIAACTAMAANIALAYILAPRMGLSGLALATALSAILNAVIVYLLITRKIGPYKIADLIKTGAAGLGMFAVGYYLKGIFLKNFIYDPIKLILPLAICIFLGIIVYIAILVVFKNPELRLLISAFKQKTGRIEKD